MTDQRTVAFIQARTGSTRLPGKVLADIEGEPLIAWTIRGVQAIPGLAAVVLATTTDPADDDLASFADGLDVAVHRGPVRDVLTRCHDAVAQFRPDVVIRQTADDPFPDPAVADAQARHLRDEGFDYVGIDGWPLGIAAEACRMAAFDEAAAEATDPADREHVMPFLYRQPDRYRIGALPRAPDGRPAVADARYTVDTEADLAFARALAARLHHGPPVALHELESILEREPELLQLNAGVKQRSHREAQGTGGSTWTS